MAEYYPPRYQSNQFHCSYCRVFAAQHWRHIVPYDRSRNALGNQPIGIENTDVEISICSHCSNSTFWLREKIIYPPTRTVLPANSDLPDDVKQIYEEAAAITDQSPRSACALLRLAIEMLMGHLGEIGSINESIKNLVKKGLNPQVQQSLDIVRVTGNNAVHPGEIDFGDTTDVQALFGLINVIADVLITQPKQIQALYDGLPEGPKKAIEKRDSKAQ
ncbi:MAG: DUF4145 domain-containing protein [Candidatus Poribacteria bacterium]|nr:DUF4145 domain-containing protein [Candidatus Poribacteria bacterium]